MQKQIHLIIYAVGLFLSAAAFAEMPATSGTCGTDCTWHFDSNTKTLSINGTGQMNDYTADLRAIETPWKAYSNDIENITIANGIQNIGYGAFAYTNVKNVNIPDSVTSIGTYAFTGCDKLMAVDLPSNLKNIDHAAFYLTSIQNMNVPESVETIASAAFAISSLQTLTISDKTDLRPSLLNDGSPHGSPAAVVIYCKGNPDVCKQNVQNTISNSNYANHPDILLKSKIWRQNRRIYTLDEALHDAGKKNSVMIRYR